MAISEKLRAFLEASRVKYSVVKHPLAYTAQEIAAAQHVPGRRLAKCVLINTDRGPVLAVLPAMHLIDLKRLKMLLRARTVTIAKESDIKQRFPDVEAGAMSPFGNLYEVPIVVDRLLAESAEIVFNAGSHTETIKMRYRDIATLAKHATGSFVQAAAVRGKRGRKSVKVTRKTAARVAKRTRSSQRRRTRRTNTSRRRTSVTRTR